MLKNVLKVVAVLLMLAGVIFFLQGIDVLKGSGLMSGKTQWAINGAISGLVGIGLFLFANRSA